MIMLIDQISSIPAEVRAIVEERIAQFKRIGYNDLYHELCFCLLTANYDSAKTMRIHDALKEEFPRASQERLASLLRSHGYRFPNTRARYIIDARAHDLRFALDAVRNGSERDVYAAREKLVTLVVGIGYKEASHYLRNIGTDRFAILDFHILDLMEREGMLRVKRPLNKKRYLEAETVLQRFGDAHGIDMARLDYYLWYGETGKVLK